ncbi:MAG TPA: hypothetical protein VGD37_36140 [Kofleriaceae bacterium]|jgi:hypothetical protein
MTWTIEADVELGPSSGMDLVRALVGFFAADVERLQVEITRGDWPIEQLGTHDLGAGELDAVAAIVAAEQAAEQGADRTVLVRPVLRGAGDFDYRPEPEVSLFGAGLVAMGNHRRRAPAVIGFGNRKAWRGKAVLPSGLALSDDTIARALQHVCTQVRPAALHLGSEEQVSIPFNDHFIYHRELDGFVRDLEDILQLSLRGGAGHYRDARARYEPALAEDSQMMFGKRRDDHLDAVRRFLSGKLPRLESQGLPTTLSLALAETAVLASDDLDFFFTDPGLGFHYKPLFAGYVEGFYLSLIDQLLGAA